MHKRCGRILILPHTVGTRLASEDRPEPIPQRGLRLLGARGIYNHVTEPMINNLVDALQRRWEATQPDGPDPVVRRLRPAA